MVRFNIRIPKSYLEILRSNWVILPFLLIVSLVFPLIILQKICLFYRLPIGGDTGNWLRASYAIFGVDYPMWGETPLQSHPLLFFMIYPLAQVLGDVWTMNVLGLSLLVLRPIAVFFFSKKLFESQSLALLSAIVDAFFPSYYEMYAWGGYPNLLGFIMLPLTLMYLLSFGGSTIKLKKFVILFLLSSLTVLSHSLTSIIFLLTAYFWLSLKLFERQYKFTFLTLLTVSLPFVIYRLIVGGVSEFVLFNEFAFYRNITMERILYATTKDLYSLLFLMILSAMGIFILFRRNRNGAVLLVSWLLSPIIFYMGIYYTRFMAIDCVRLFFFIVSPLIISVVYSLKILLEKKNHILVLGLAALLICLSLNFGYRTMNAAIFWNKRALENAYSDINSYDTIMWIKSNLANDSVLCIRAPVITRYVEGIAHRRVLYGAPLQFLAKLNQIERSLAAEAVLTSNIFGYSDMFMIRDQSPGGHTPNIYMFAGVSYASFGYFSDHYPGKLGKLTLDVSEVNLGEDFCEIKYNGSYPEVYTIKTITLKSDEVSVNYKILGEDGGFINMSLSNYFWFTSGKNWEFRNGTLSTDYGDVEVITNAYVEKEYVSMWKQWRLVFNFNGQLTVTFKTNNRRIVMMRDVVLTTSNDLIKLYGVTHALIRVNDREAMRWAESSGWELLYNNEAFYLYKVTPNYDEFENGG